MDLLVFKDMPEYHRNTLFFIIRDGLKLSPIGTFESDLEHFRGVTFAKIPAMIKNHNLSTYIITRIANHKLNNFSPRIEIYAIV